MQKIKIVDADFEGNISVPMLVFSEEGRKQIGEAYKQVGAWFEKGFEAVKSWFEKPEIVVDLPKNKPQYEIITEEEYEEAMKDKPKENKAEFEVVKVKNKETGEESLEVRQAKELFKFKISGKWKENAAIAEQHSNDGFFQKAWWFYNKVKGNAIWDYKEGGKKPEMEHVGNFNYGIVGTAAGYSEQTLRAGAGGYQIYKGTADVAFFNTYFDDPVDQLYIEEGINWYKEYVKNQENLQKNH